MTIPKCCGEVVKNQVYGSEFYFCRGCKKEVNDSPKSLPNFVVNSSGLSSIRTGSSGQVLSAPSGGVVAWTPPPVTTIYGHQWDINKDKCKHCVMSGADIGYAMNNGILVPACPGPDPAITLHLWNPALDECDVCGITGTEYQMAGRPKCCGKRLLPQLQTGQGWSIRP